MEEKAMFKPESLLGEVLDRKYRLTLFLGEGSSSWVYAAEQMLDDEFRALYAIKVLRPKTFEHRKALLRDFNAAARLSHPGLVQFHGAFDVPDGPFEGVLCQVMELCEGTLSNRLQAGRRLAVGEALGVARDVAEALAWLHGQNVVHRDLKPGNVFRAGNRWKLGDLGLVRIVEGELCDADGFCGTPLYMSPEGWARQVSTASDVWSLGVTLQEALTGVLPYSGSTAYELINASATQEPAIASDLPRPFDAVVRGCLVKDPRKRWTAQQVLEALEESSPALAQTSVVSVSPRPGVSTRVGTALFDQDAALGWLVDGRYRLARSCGNGAFGWVFAADEVVGTEVVGQCAVKLLQPRDSDARKSVLSEMRAGAALTRSHPGLLSHLAFGEVAAPGVGKSYLYLTMELAEHSLGDCLKRPDRLGAAETGRMARDVAEALAWLHGRGVVHRDIKPDNVLYADGRWKLGDLGLVRPVDGILVRTVHQSGTPLYRAPETLDEMVGASVDVWALGVMLQQCLTGVLAYTASNDVALVKAMMAREPTIAPDLPSPFDAVVRGCLVKDPRARWTAQQVLEALSTGSSPTAPRPSVVSVPRSEVVPSAPRGLVALGRNAQGRERFQVEGGGPVLVGLPAGRFRMGSPAGEEGRFDDEIHHEVVLSRGFLLGEVPVTQAEYAAVVGANPSGFQDLDRPVEQVSWFDAVSFCNALSRRVGLEEAYVVNGTQVRWKGLSCPGFRLPTAAEWEYACRAGTTGARYGNLDDVAWYSSNSGSTTHPVRRKQPNAWGLYDTLGNVFEWCWDWWDTYPSGVVTDPVGPGSGSYRVGRGGSWSGGAQFARAAYRGRWTPGRRFVNLGFRLARSLP